MIALVLNFRLNRRHRKFGTKNSDQNTLITILAYFKSFTVNTVHLH